MRSHLYHGTVQHHRFAPREHRFQYAIRMLGLDLEALPQALDHAWFGHRRPAPIRYHRADYFGDARQTLATTVREHVKDEAGIDIDGRIELITTLRTLGYAFNPVSFYLCHDRDGDLRCILAEITNTPWRERCVYVLPDHERTSTGAVWRFAFDKAFHISPFMPMNQRYEWAFRVSDKGLGVHMRVLEDDELRFTATMGLRAQAMTAGRLTRHALAMPLAPIQIVARIYWQALRLWWKRTPFYSHPASDDRAGAYQPMPEPKTRSVVI